MKDRKVRAELNRLKLRLFGDSNTDCLNVSTSDRTNSILGGHRHRIQNLEDTVHELRDVISELTKPKKRAYKKRK